MSINNISALFKAIDERDDFRTQLHACNSRGALLHCLEREHMAFTLDEFEQAITLLHVKCQSQEAANELFAKANWFRFLYYSLKTSSNGNYV